MLVSARLVSALTLVSATLIQGCESRSTAQSSDPPVQQAAGQSGETRSGSRSAAGRDGNRADDTASGSIGVQDRTPGPAGTSENVATGTTTAYADLQAESFTKGDALDLNNIFYKVSYLTFSKEGKLQFAERRARITLDGLPVNTAGTMKFDLYEGAEHRFTGSSENITMKPGTNQVAITLKRVVPVTGSADIVVTIADEPLLNQTGNGDPVIIDPGQNPGNTNPVSTGNISGGSQPVNPPVVTGGTQNPDQGLQQNNTGNTGNSDRDNQNTTNGQNGRQQGQGTVRAYMARQAAGHLHIPVTPFSNMASGYQATNEGFRALLKSDGKLIAAGEMNMEAVVNGYQDDASRGALYGRLILKVALDLVDGSVTSGALSGERRGTLSICMAADEKAPLEDSRCQSVQGNIHPERPFQYIDMQVTFKVGEQGQISVVRYHGNTGEGGTAGQIALAVYHPAYGFAAPGKAFKDYQSPLVLDLNRNGRLDLVDVWDETRPVKFDLTGSGTALRTGWVDRGDGLLALDLNGNGSIDSGAELFGEHTAVPGSARNELGRTFDDGFLALGRFDDNSDGQIDQKDRIFGKLLVWRDLNQNGISEKPELISMTGAGISSLSLAYTRNHGERFLADNDVRLISSWLDSKGRRQIIGDVWFKVRRHVEVLAREQGH